MENCWQIEIYGKVQGVFFRKSTKAMADQIGVKGYVMNRSDESVVVVAKGTSEQLEQLLSYCHKGPENAIVCKVVQNNIDEKEAFEQFNIRY